MIWVYVLILILFFTVPNIALAESLKVTGSLSESHVNVGKDILVTITIQNPSDFKYKGFDLQITQTGFSKIEGKTWPTIIEPHSNLMGTLTLEAKKSGLHKIGLISSYNITIDGVSQQDFIYSDIGIVKVAEIPFKVTEQTSGAFTAIIAGLIGAGITGVASYFRGRLDERKVEEKENAAKETKKETDFNRTKGLLLSELNINKKKITLTLSIELKNWNIIKNEGLYQIISKNTVLEEKISELYVELEQYNDEIHSNVTDERKNQLKKWIDEVVTLIISWEYAP